ncbi:hypothetical protein COCMIDRAFT_41082 [Bipolaris oryzae ATCC 44560]|uniref:Aminoglycoside phosphotransferase domain-containing protein n=1 Tax=Bipolaris oryzae ATCC 44560 TaxID=930090 RepID=W6YMU7_COCMI|nr:uncharacterized protein COCMIDRAFT_41082 [Bipolaris oryzae ATCC 44560]EUC40612.1 hypothetical protein COCMIDRAFT_41082 [Bipolaris oryzae ATCC 44560]
MTTYPKISLAELPDCSQLQMDFPDTAWFKTHGQTQQFPTHEHLLSLVPNDSHSNIVKFEDLSLAVKFGRHVTTTEAINIWVVRRMFQEAVPVPELYGWRVLEQEGKGRYVFIYMQLIQGPTLLERWPELSCADKQAICTDLRAMVSSLRSLQDSELQQMIGNICRGPGEDVCLKEILLLRPFPSRAEFHDWLSWSWRRRVPNPQSIPDPWRDLLPDNGPIVFTHGDLHRGNIIVSATSPIEIVAIIDWQSSGWYPDYWEYCKALFTAEWGKDWWDCIHQFLDSYPQEFETFDFYMRTNGIF